MKPTGYLPGLAGLLCLLAGPALAADIAVPPDVAAFAKRGLQCRDWSATEITDAATDYRVEHALIGLRCDALAADGGALRVKYAQSPQALRTLDDAGDIGP